jgi:hypothetical protein
MSSTYAVYPPSSVVDSSKLDRMNEPRIVSSSESLNHSLNGQASHLVQSQAHAQFDNQFDTHIPPFVPVGTPSLFSTPNYNPGHNHNHLSPFSPSQQPSDSASPVLNSHTPAESISALSIHYQSSEFSEPGDDPFFGIDLNNFEGSPSFLDEGLEGFLHSVAADPSSGIVVPRPAVESLDHAPEGPSYCPISPDQTPSLHTTSPHNGANGDGAHAVFSGPVPSSISPRDLARLPKHARGSLDLNNSGSGSQLTPDTSGSGRSSEDGLVLVPPRPVMNGQSPRVTVSLWGRDNVDATAPNPGGPFSGIAPDDLSVPYPMAGQPTLAHADDDRPRTRYRSASHGGLDPEHRPSTEVPISMNQMAAQRQVDERNHEVDEWLSRAQTMPRQGDTPRPSNRALPEQPRLQTGDEDDGIPLREIALGHETDNVVVPGQAYYTGTGGEFTQEDLDIIRQNRIWGNAPVLFPISRADSGRFQPATSQAAIERFERMCRDTDSIVSRAATWGTRRRSLPSVSDIEDVTGGSFLKKLSLSRSDSRRPNFLKDLRGLVRKPSASFKRSRPEPAEEEPPASAEPSIVRRDSLAPPTRSLSWGRKQAVVPSINTAFIAMGSNMASIGTSHARSGSISATPITSPRSPGGFGLTVTKHTGRNRSKSDLPKPSSLASMWKKTGGPPVSSFAKSAAPAPAPVSVANAAAADAEDDDEEEDDLDENDESKHDNDEAKAEADQIIEEITPNFAGFQQHVLKLNPMLAADPNSKYLVDRIAHQQIIRYKGLLNLKVKHLQQTATGHCPSGSLCIALGGSARTLDAKGDQRGLGALSARFDGSDDGDMTPLEGAINQESFPCDIPMPPHTTLPAEFECQLCYQPKKFQKPSDWTKHVHEDVQPFTCTWPSCRDPKIFKRKADWVRHENEGHRHLEWWTCDVEDCRHVCFRRDNFLQHLVREHKFPEPKVKTKAAIKRAGAVDPTWQKVEKCHEETSNRPSNEACRFCGQSFPTWKKLTVHLAKHMERISLPILRLVERRALEADTIISPVQDPPPRPFPATFPDLNPTGVNQSIKREPQPFDHYPLMAAQAQAEAQAQVHAQMARSMRPMAYPTTPQQQHPQQFMFSMPQSSHYQPQPMYHGQLDTMSPAMGSSPHMGVQHGFTTLSPQGYAGLPVTTGAYMAANPAQYISVAPDAEPFPAMTMDALGLHDPTGLGGVGVGPMHFGGMLDPSSAGADQYPTQGSATPFSHSPHQRQGGFM